MKDAVTGQVVVEVRDMKEDAHSESVKFSLKMAAWIVGLCIVLVVIYKNDYFPKTTEWLTDAGIRTDNGKVFDLGMRSDGVMIWREHK